MDDLTREQQKLLTSMYKEVLSRQPAVSFDEANYFANSDVVMDHFCPDSDSDHVSSLCWSLASAGYITCEPGEDLANEIKLTDKTIIYMEIALDRMYAQNANTVQMSFWPAALFRLAILIICCMYMLRCFVKI